MSTPISQGSNLKGLELYAPRRADIQSGPTRETSPQTSQPASAIEETLMQEEQNDRDWNDDDSVEAAFARLDDAIQTAIDVGRVPDSEQFHIDAPQLPPAPKLNWPNDENVPSYLPASDMPGKNHADANVGSWRRSLLDPVVMPEPVDTRQRRMSPWLIRYALMIGGAAIVAYGIAMVSFPQPRQAVRVSESSTNTTVVEKEAETTPTSRLVVEDQRAFANEPMPLEVTVDNAVQNASLRLAGLATGTRLSSGLPVGVSSWQLPLDNLKNLYLYAPTNFVGVMNSAVDLLGPDKRLIDRREVRFEWLAKKESLPQPVLPQPVLPQPDGAIQPTNSATVPSMSAESASSLMRRGQDFLKAGDIAAARILFARLADAGIADGAFGMAETYDARYLTEHKVLGVVGDESKARAFYQRAKQLGSTEAANVLERIGKK